MSTILRQSHLGNSIGGYLHIQKDCLNLAVSADGHVYVPGSYDEAGCGCGIYYQGARVGQAGLFNIATDAVAVDGTYVYVGAFLVDPATHSVVFGLRRLSMAGSYAGFPISDGSQTNFLSIGPKRLTAVFISGTELYVADPATSSVRVFDLATMQESRALPIPGTVHRLAVDNQGRIWILNGSAVALCYDAKTGAAINMSISGIGGAGAICVDANGHLRIGGIPYRINTYDVSGSTPKLLSQFGVVGGLYAGATPGLLQDAAFYSIVGLGTDAQNNLYVAQRSPAIGGSTDLKAFDPHGNLLWHLYANQFIDNADVDPGSNGTSVYTRDEHFVYDASQPQGHDWVWQGMTLNPAYDDMRVQGRVASTMYNQYYMMVRRLNGGKLYGFLKPGGYLGIYRQGAGETWIPSGLIPTTNAALSWPPHQPANPYPRKVWVWRDSNGDGKCEQNEFTLSTAQPSIDSPFDTYVDSAGTLWFAAKEHGIPRLGMWKCAGFDNVGNPIYNDTDLVWQANPSNFIQLCRIWYLPETDTLFVSGVTSAHQTFPAPGSDSVGSEVARFDAWSSGSATLTWQAVLPSEPKNPNFYFAGLSIAGKYLFLVNRNNCDVSVMDAATGAMVETISRRPDFSYNQPYADMHYAVTACALPDGSYRLFEEDDLVSNVCVLDVTLP